MQYVAQWYTHLTGVRQSDPRVLYGSLLIEADDLEDAQSQWDDLIDLDFFRGEVFQLIPQVGAVAFDIDTLPDTWNFDEVVCVDLQLAAERHVEVDGTVLHACDERAAYFEDRCNHAHGWHGGRVGTMYAPMNSDGSADLENAGVIEVAYEDA